MAFGFIGTTDQKNPWMAFLLECALLGFTFSLIVVVSILKYYNYCCLYLFAFIIIISWNKKVTFQQGLAYLCPKERIFLTVTNTRKSYEFVFNERFKKVECISVLYPDRIAPCEPCAPDMKTPK